MKHLFVPYKLALKLKEKGFDEPCLAHWKWSPKFSEGVLYRLKFSCTDKSNAHRCQAPLYQQVIDWFREKHSIFISPENRNEHLIVRGWNRKTNEHFIGDSNEPREANHKAIEEALKLI